MVDPEELGLSDAFGPGNLKEAKNRTNNLWSLMKLRNAVETNKEGIDRLFQLLADMINGGEMWGKVGEIRGGKNGSPQLARRDHVSVRRAVCLFEIR